MRKWMVVVALVVSARPLTTAARVESTTTVFQATFDYYYVDLQGTVTRRERISGTYSRDRERQTDSWNHVTIATAQGMTEFGPAVLQPTLEGFTYPLRATNTSSPEFFKSVPAVTLQEKNLIFDTRMFDLFGEETFDQLTPNEPHPFGASNGSVELAGSGQFTNADVQLTLTGTTSRDGEQCAVVDYRAFFNHFEVKLPQFSMKGRSHYWGQVWVALPRKEIQHATLYEDVLGQEVTGGTTAGQPTNVFRIGTLTRIAVR